MVVLLLLKREQKNLGINYVMRMNVIKPVFAHACLQVLPHTNSIKFN